jgi:hypothetical protein
VQLLTRIQVMSAMKLSMTKMTMPLTMTTLTMTKMTMPLTMTTMMTKNCCFYQDLMNHCCLVELRPVDLYLSLDVDIHFGCNSCKM